MRKVILIVVLALFIAGCAYETRCIPIVYQHTGASSGVNRDTYWFKGIAWQDVSDPRFQGFVIAESFEGVYKRSSGKPVPVDCTGYPKMPRGFYHVIFNVPGEGGWGTGWSLEGEIFLKSGSVWVYPKYLPERALEAMTQGTR